MRLLGVKSTSELVEACWPEAYRIAYSVLRNEPDAEDAAQEACAQLHVASPDLHDERAFKRWFYRIAVRKAYDVARHRHRHRHADTADVATLGHAVEDSVDLGRALDRLPLTQRLPVIFHYYYGFPDNEISVILGTTHAAVRVRLFAARRSLRRLLETDSIVEGSVCHD